MPKQNSSAIRCPGRIAAVRLTENLNGDPKLGQLTHLEPGTPLEVCGIGYNERTVKVGAKNQFFYVFKQDIGVA